MVPGYLAFQGVTDGLPNLVESMFVTFAEEETSPVWCVFRSATVMLQITRSIYPYSGNLYTFPNFNDVDTLANPSSIQSKCGFWIPGRPEFLWQGPRSCSERCNLLMVATDIAPDKHPRLFKQLRGKHKCVGVRCNCRIGSTNWSTI